MKYSYHYEARVPAGQVIKGTLVASSRAMAMIQLKKTGMTPRKVTLDVLGSLTAWKSGDFDSVELGRLYVTLGRRMARGRQLTEGLEQAVEYVNDHRLKQAMVVMRQALIDGQAPHQAMLAAGFPRRDAMVIKATTTAGKSSQAFESLGAEVKRAAALSKSVKAVFFMPSIMLVFMVIFMWAALSFFAPITMEFLKNAGATRNLMPFLQGYFAFAEAFNAHWVPASIVYFGAAGGLLLGARTKPVARAFDRLPAIRELSVKSDHAALWNAFTQMYDASVSGPEAAVMAASAARRDDSRAAFERLSAQLAAGAALDVAVMKAGFPRFVVGGVSSAVSGGELSRGLRDMVDILEEDVGIVTEKFKETVRFASLIVIAVAVLGVFLVTYFPIMAATLSNT